MVRRKRHVAQKQKAFWSWLRVPLTAARKKSIIDNLMHGLDAGNMLNLDLRRRQNLAIIDDFLKQQIVSMPRILRHRFERQPDEMLRRLRTLISQSKLDYTPTARRSITPVDRETHARDEPIYVYASEEFEDLQRPLSFMLNEVSAAIDETIAAYGGWVPYSELEFWRFGDCLDPLDYNSGSQDIYYRIPSVDNQGQKVIVGSMQDLKAAIVVMQLRQLPLEFYLGPWPPVPPSSSSPSASPQQPPSGSGGAPTPLHVGTKSPSNRSTVRASDDETGNDAPEGATAPQTPTVSDMINQGPSHFQHWRRPSFTANLVANDIISVATQDITTVQVNCIVNGISHPRGSSGLDAAVHQAAGPALREACEALGECRVAEVQMTDAFDLPCSKIIHTLSPAWDADDLESSREKLRIVYRRCLELGLEERVRTIAFPAISTGSQGFPSTRAAVVALEEVRQFLDEPDHLLQFDKIVFCNLHEADVDAYRIFLGQFFPGPTGQGTSSPEKSTSPEPNNT